MSIQGLHHITLACADAQRTVNFYTGILGQRFVKKTVNFDDPGSYHLYFGDEVGTPGTAVTFFEWRNSPRGYPGIGGTHHFALTVADYNGLLMWKRRLTDLGISVSGPVSEGHWASITFNDPDGAILEIATRGPGWTNTPEEYKATDTWPSVVGPITHDMALSHGMHHITAFCADIERTDAFWAGLLELSRLTSTQDGTGCPQRYWGVGEGQAGTLVSYVQKDRAQERSRRLGVGQTHHFALAVGDEQIQLEWREKLIDAGLRVSPVMDRCYFKSIYTNDPDGHIVELATMGPGFPVDEPVAELGQNLKLPPWLEQMRGQIEQVLTPITVPAWMPPET